MVDKGRDVEIRSFTKQNEFLSLFVPKLMLFHLQAEGGDESLYLT